MSALNVEQRQAVDRAKEKLVPAAEAMLEAASVQSMKPNDFGDSQLRNLIAVANETESPAVVVNFIRYQTGRDPGGRSWNMHSNGQTLGERMVHELDDGAIQKALESCRGVISEPLDEQLIRIELVRHFLGFASRHLKFLRLGSRR